MSTPLASDCALAPAELALLDAGLALATLAEEDIQACGNSPPPCEGCPGCDPSRDALLAWARAVVGFRKHAALVSPAALLARCIAAVEAMPDFAGRPARADGMTHRCAGCGAWLAEAYTRRTPEHGLHHVLLLDGPGRVPEERPCGPVHDLSPVEGVLRADVIAVLRRAMEET